MEFNFRSIDGKYSTYIPRPSTSSVSYFPEQALRVRYSRPNFGNEVEYFRIPNPVEEVVHRELEKKWIREEIIYGEITRRLTLEEEVRREMIVERQLALHRGGDGLEPRRSVLHQSEGRSLEERIVLLERMNNGGRRGGFEKVPFQLSTEPKINEVKRPSDVASKERVIFLAKPERNTSGTKRKAVSPPTAGATEPPSVGSKKKLKEEWSCAICQVTASSKRDLNGHLRGKKHKSKEAGLKAQRAGKNHAIRLFPKKAAKTTKLGKPVGNKNLDRLEKSTTEGVKPNNELVLAAFHDTGDSKNKNGDSSKKMRGNDGDSKQKRFKFLCKMCKVGAFSVKEMNKHKKGKKHVGWLLWLEKRSRSKASVKVEETTRNRESEPEVSVKAEEKEETPENEDVDGTDDGKHVEDQEATT